MRSLIAAVFSAALLMPANAAPTKAVTGSAALSGDRPVVLAINPQPEPPGKGKIKRIYTKEPDSRRLKPIKAKPVNTPATKY